MTMAESFGDQKQISRENEECHVAHTGFLWDDENMVMLAQLPEDMRSHCIGYFKRKNFRVCELYFKKKPSKL